MIRMTTLRLLIPLLVFTALCTAASGAQTVEWKLVSGSTGFDGLYPGDQGRILSSLGNVAYYSDDDGISWTKTLTASPTLFQIAANGSKAVFSQYNSGQRKFEMLLSTDNGITWTLAFREPQIRTVNHYFFMVSDSGVVFSFGGDGRLSRFTGSAWVALGVPFPGASGFYQDTRFTFPVFLPELTYTLIGTTFYVGTQGDGIYSTTDYGATWTRMLTGKYVGAISPLPDGKIVVGCDYVIFSGNPAPPPRTGGVFILSPNGETQVPRGLDGQSYYHLTILKDQSIVAFTSTGLYRNTPGTPSWTTLNLSPDQSAAIWTAPGGTLFATSPSIGINRSTDDGDTWYANSIFQKNLFTLNSPAVGTIWAGTYGQGVFRSTTGGAGWSQSPEGSVNPNVYALAEAGSTVLAGTSGGVYISGDGGTTWSNRSSSYFTGAAYALAFDRTGMLFAGTNFGVYRSSDTGSTWSKAGPNQDPVLFLAAAGDPGNRIYAAADSGRISFTSDQGETWNQIGPVREDIQALAADSSGRIIAGVFGSVLMSPDGGATWLTSTVFAGTWVNSVAIRDPLTYAAATDDGIYISHDGGFTWSAGGLQGSQVMAVCFDPNNTLIAGVYGVGVYATAKSITGVGAPVSVLPIRTSLSPAYPNPFNSGTTIRFTLDSQTHVSLRIFDVLGREVAVLADENRQPGSYSVSWNAPEIAGGAYFCRLQTGSHTFTSKLLLVR
jgi:photosystem II stability/assembly factor-like uncharacterized protein